MLWVWSLCSWGSDKIYFSFLTCWKWSLSNSLPPPSKRFVTTHHCGTCWSVSEISHLIRYQQELCILVAWIGWKFFWNRIVKWTINWQNVWYKINIHLCLFYILIFNGHQVLMCFMVFIKSYTVSTIWSRTAQKCVFFYLFSI